MKTKTLFFVFILSACFVYSQNEEVNYFIGEWNLQLWNKGNKTEVPDLIAKWKVESGLDSTFCLIGNVQIDGMDFTKEMITFNPYSKEYVRTIAANTGSYFTLFSSGWKGDKLIWRGNQFDSDKKTELKVEIVKVSQNEFKATYFKFLNNEWIQTEKEVLKRII